MQIAHRPKLIMQTCLTFEAFWQVFIYAPAILFLAIIVAFFEENGLLLNYMGAPFSHGPIIAILDIHNHTDF